MKMRDELQYQLVEMTPRQGLDALALAFMHISKILKPGHRQNQKWLLRKSWTFTPVPKTGTGLTPTNKMVCAILRGFNTEVDENGKHRKAGK
jgi:hypothetical protein